MSSKSNGQSWFTLGRVAALLGTFIFISSWDVVCGWMSFYIRDFGYFGYPLAYYHREAFWRGELPLWNPLSCTGIPFLAQWNTLVLYPGSLVYLLLPLPYGLNLFVLLHQLLAGVAMFLLARQWTGHSLGAMAAAIIFAFNGLTLNGLMWPNNIAALGWMPLVILFCERALIAGGRAIPLAAATGAMQMLAGAPEIIVMTWLICAAIAVGHAYHAVRLRQPWGVGLRRFGLAAICTAGIAAAQLLPFLQLLAHSDRRHPFESGGWSLPGMGWANYLLPLFGFFRSPAGVFFQPEQNWTSSYYVGIGTVALAILAIWKARRSRVWMLGALALAGVVLAMGDNGLVYPFLVKIFPPLAALRYPVKFVVWPAFCLPLLAAYAFAPVKRDEATPRRLGVICAALMVIVFGLAGLGSWVLPVFDASVSPWSHAGGRAALLLAIAGLFALREAGGSGRIATLPPKLRQVFSASLLVLFWADVLSHAPDQNPTIAPAALAPGLIAASQKMDSQPQFGEARALLSLASHERIQRILANPENDYLGHRAWLYGNVNLLEGIPLVDGFFSLYLANQRDVFTLVFINQSLARLQDFLGISQISDEEHELQWKSRRSLLPLVTGGQSPILADRRDTLAGLNSDRFDPRRVVYLPLETAFKETSPEAGKVTVEPMAFSAHRIEFTTRAETPGLVVISQSYYPAWRAFVNGNPTPILQANLAFQAIQVSAGSSHVELRYRDSAFQAGAGISVLTLSVCVVWWFRAKQRPA